MYKVTYFYYPHLSSKNKTSIYTTLFGAYWAVFLSMFDVYITRTKIERVSK